MATRPSESAATSGGEGWFASTQWNVVLAAGDRQTPGAEEALEALCRAYWHPLYTYVRGTGHTPEDAQDLTQEFFARFLAKDSVILANRERGRFRTFLLTALKHFLVNERVRACRLKRGGGQPLLSLDFGQAESRCRLEPADSASPDRLYVKRWALTLLDRAFSRLSSDYAGSGRERLFDVLKDYIWGPNATASYAAIALELGMTEGAVKVNVHRIRRRFQELLRAEVAQTVAARGEIDEEPQDLIAALATPGGG